MVGSNRPGRAMPALVHAAAIEPGSEPAQRNFSQHFLLLARDRMGKPLGLTLRPRGRQGCWPGHPLFAGAARPMPLQIAHLRSLQLSFYCRLDWMSSFTPRMARLVSFGQIDCAKLKRAKNLLGWQYVASQCFRHDTDIYTGLSCESSLASCSLNFRTEQS